MGIGGKAIWIGGIFQLVLLLGLCMAIGHRALAAPEGINVYKDILRGKSDEDYYDGTISEEGEPKLFFFRTPVSSYAGLNLADTFETYGKRTFNKYKNMMLNKDVPEILIEDPEEIKESAKFYIPRIMPKRTPGAILSWAIPAANRVRVISTNYRPPGINRPAA
ncbi:uncharacterized protein LOC129739157 [Uranotaenia lowii]|uniref:uncharacterized protein LOC129739157 n=1 Tax=Uranotaenia lowii TaxID=190385 RepID=UPI00247A88B2|nr:uncharacterized protein LOC129739157 [Uranotaenia lowii]